MSVGGFGLNGIVTNGLVLNLDAANRRSFVSGSTSWYDLSGRNNTGTLNGGVTYNSSNGGSLIFNGSTGYVDLINTSTFSSNTLTIDFTFKITSYPPSFAYVIGKQYDNQYGSFAFYTTGNQLFYMSVGTTVNNSNSSVFTPSLNTWYNVVGVYDGTNMLFYINNSLISTTAYGGGAPIRYNSNSINIGRYGNTYPTSLYSPIVMGYFKLYNRALSATEISQNYNTLKNRYQ